MSSLRPVQPYHVDQPYSGGRVKGLFIGINYHGSSSELRGCVNDVKTMLATLEKIKFPLAEAIILVDESNFPGLAGPPTKANIETGLKWLSAGARPGDTLFLHYSGHGTTQKNHNSTEASGFDELLVPVDYDPSGMIIDDDIWRWVVQPLCPGTRLTAVMDCCHSGTLMDLPYQFVATSEAMQGYNESKLGGFELASQNRSDADVILFSGCSDEQTSSDVTRSDFRIPGNHAGAAGGACTGALAEELATTAGLSFVDMLLGVRQSLRKRGFKQVAQLSATKPIDLTRPFSFFGPLQAPASFTAAPAPRPVAAAAPPQQPVAPPLVPTCPPSQPACSGCPPQQQGQSATYPGAPSSHPPPQQPGYPPPQQPGYPPPQQPGYPPPQQPGYPPPQQPGYRPPQQPGYPPQQSAYPGPGAGYPPQQPGYPPQQPGGFAGPGYPPPQQPGYPPQQSAYPGPGAGYPPPQQPGGFAGPGYPPPQQPGYPPPQQPGGFAGPGYPPPQQPGYPPPQQPGFAGPGYPPPQQPGYPPPQGGAQYGGYRLPTYGY